MLIELLRLINKFQEEYFSKSRETLISISQAVFSQLFICCLKDIQQFFPRKIYTFRSREYFCSLIYESKSCKLICKILYLLTINFERPSLFEMFSNNKGIIKCKNKRGVYSSCVCKRSQGVK